MLFTVFETMSESRTVSHANDTKQQAQQHWIHKVPGNTRRGRFPAETPLERFDLKVHRFSLRVRASEHAYLVVL